MNESGTLHRPVCRLLRAHQVQMAAVHMRDLFAADPARFDRFSLQVGELLLDYSKNRITDETMELLVRLAGEADVAGWRERMFSGDKINHTENRPALHTALRGDERVTVGGEDVRAQVRRCRERMRVFAAGEVASRNSHDERISRTARPSESARAGG